MSFLGTQKVTFQDKEITYFNCRDCGMRYKPLENNTMRPNNKFCDKQCMMYVLEVGLQKIGNRPRGWKQWIEDNTTPKERAR